MDTQKNTKIFLSKPVRELAEKYSLSFYGKEVQGTVNGYLVSLCECPPHKKLSVALAIDPESDAAMDLKIYLESANVYSLEHYELTPSHLILYIKNTFGLPKRFVSSFEGLIEKLRELNVSGSDICFRCMAPLNSAPSETVRISGAPTVMHRHCADEFAASVDYCQKEYNLQAKNYGKGFLGSLLGSLVGGVVFVAVYLIGYFSGWVGFIMCWLGKFGYEKLGGKNGKGKIWIVSVNLFLSVLISYFIAIWIMLFPDWQAEGASFFDVPFGIAYMLYESAEVRSAFLGEMGMALLFSGIGLLILFRNLKEDSTGIVLAFERTAKLQAEKALEPEEVVSALSE